MADPVAPAARLARSVSISISNPKKKGTQTRSEPNRSALTWAKGIQIEIEIVSRLLNLKHQTAEVSDEWGPSGAGPIREKTSVEGCGGGLQAAATVFDNRLENSLSNSKSMGYVIFPSKSENEISA